MKVKKCCGCKRLYIDNCVCNDPGLIREYRYRRMPKRKYIDNSIGLEIEQTEYNLPKPKIGVYCYDGSITGAEHKILTNIENFYTTTWRNNLAKTLYQNRLAGSDVDSSTGFHIHIPVAFINSSTFINNVQALNRVIMTVFADRFGRYVSEYSQRNRYSWVNVRGNNRYTERWEIRVKHGTLNPTTVCDWIEFWLKLASTDEKLEQNRLDSDYYINWTLKFGKEIHDVQFYWFHNMNGDYFSNWKVFPRPKEKVELKGLSIEHCWKCGFPKLKGTKGSVCNCGGTLSGEKTNRFLIAPERLKCLFGDVSYFHRTLNYGMYLPEEENERLHIYAFLKLILNEDFRVYDEDDNVTMSFRDMLGVI